MYKLIALDLDGTLNNDKKIITPETRDALLKVQQAGAIVVLASGRPISGLNREAKALEINKYHGIRLAYNGGMIKDETTNEIIYQNPIPTPLAKRLLRHLEQFPVVPIADNGTYIYTDQPKGFQMEYESSNNELAIKEVDNVADAIDFAPIKILIASPAEDLQPILHDISAPFEDEMSFILSTPFYYECTMFGIDKAASLAMLCDKLGIKKEEVMAFGDAQNDKSMLQYAGMGVAMGNACDELKQIADDVTLSNNEDGIAVSLKKYFPEVF